MNLDCPRCESSDRVTKVSGINAAQSAGYSTTALAHRLGVPVISKEGYPSGAGWLIAVTLLLVLGAFLVNGAFLVLAVAPVVLIVVLKYKENARIDDFNNQSESAWERLYYCARDDIVFIPGVEDTEVPSSEMKQLIFSIIANQSS